MKKSIYLIPVLTGLLFALAFRGCSENNGVEMAPEDENLVLFEDLSLLENVSASPLDNHIYRIELLGQNEELERIIEEVSMQTNLERLNIYDVKKFFSNNSEVLMYSIPFSDNDNRIIVYRYSDLFQVNIAEYENMENGHTRFRMKTTDGSLYYGLEITGDNKAGNFVHAPNDRINTFNNNVYETSRRHPEMGAGVLKEKNPDDTCCRRMEDWEGCFTCTTEFFLGKWYGLVAYAAIGPEFVAAIGISCIGAGPNTFC